MKVVQKPSRNNGGNGSSDLEQQQQNTSSNQNINLYQDIPTLEVSLDDFEEFALDRLKVRARSAM
jgi:hypothetical protein